VCIVISDEIAAFDAVEVETAEGAHVDIAVGAPELEAVDVGICSADHQSGELEVARWIERDPRRDGEEGIGVEALGD